METRIKHLFVIGFFILAKSICLAEGPKYKHKSPAIQFEFENVYQDLRTGKSVGVTTTASGTCIDSPTFCVDSSLDTIGVGTTPDSSNVLHINTNSGGIRIDSTEFGGGAGSGRLGPIGLVISWTTNTATTGDYVAIVNGQFVENSGNTDEYAELGVVLIDNTEGSEDSAINLLARGGGKTFLSGGSNFNFYPSSGTGAIYRVGYPITPTQTQPFVDGAGGAYVYSTNSFPNGITGGAQPQVPINENYTARSTNPVIVMLGDHLKNTDGFKVYVDTVAANSGYTPTLRFFVNNSSAQTNVPTYIRGTSSNNATPALYYGETISSVTAANTNFATSGQYDDLTAVVLTPGHWKLTAVMNVLSNGATFGDSIGIGISANSGNTSSGLVAGDNAGFGMPPSAATTTQALYSIPNYEVKLNATTTYYLKRYASYSVATPKATGRLTAMRY